MPYFGDASNKIRHFRKGHFANRHPLSFCFRRESCSPLQHHFESSFGLREVNFSIEVLQERKSTFGPLIVPKWRKDISDIDRNILSIYGRNLSTIYPTLYFEEKNGGVKCETQPYFENLKHNDISATFNHLLECVYQIQIGD